ncbi:MAG: hypothetical protein IT234_01270, partial [Bacteroidia bacterium]|nr:hypothetical protein [Bacteroidia bacterium]
MKTQEIIKKTFLLGILFFALTSCKETVTKEEHVHEVELLSTTYANSMDSLEHIYTNTLDEIDSNLDMMRNEYGILLLGPNSNADYGLSKKEQIIHGISAINNVMAQNRQKIEKLEKSLKANKNDKIELVRSLERAKAQIEEQEHQLNLLKEELVKRDFKIDELNQIALNREETINTLNKQNAEQKMKLECKHFVYGTKKQLAQKQVLVKEKGLLRSMGKKTLNSNLNEGEFVGINMYSNTEIPIEGKDPKLLTKHPTNSYHIKTNEDQYCVLTITNPDEFWRAT